VLVELRLDQPHRQARRPHLGRADLAEEVGQRADVVLVPVGEHDCEHAVAALPQVGEVREHEVDAEVLVAGEREACVDDHDRAVRLVDGHVLAHLAEAAERDDPAGAVGHPGSVRRAGAAAAGVAAHPSRGFERLPEVDMLRRPSDRKDRR
jgi:hypothetical protein